MKGFLHANLVLGLINPSTMPFDLHMVDSELDAEKYVHFSCKSVSLWTR